MDTDDLSTETYKGIILEAERFNRDLTLQFGVMADSCKNEQEYLNKAKKLIEEIKRCNDSELEDIFFGSAPSRALLEKTLDKIVSNIKDIENIPEDQRHFDF